MVKNAERMRRFEIELLKKGPRISLRQKLRIYDALWKEAKKLGIINRKNALEGFDKDIRVAKIIHSCLTRP